MLFERKRLDFLDLSAITRNKWIYRTSSSTSTRNCFCHWNSSIFEAIIFSFHIHRKLICLVNEVKFLFFAGCSPLWLFGIAIFASRVKQQNFCPKHFHTNYGEIFIQTQIVLEIFRLCILAHFGHIFISKCLSLGGNSFFVW